MSLTPQHKLGSVQRMMMFLWPKTRDEHDLARRRRGESRSNYAGVKGTSQAECSDAKLQGLKFAIINT